MIWFDRGSVGLAARATVTSKGTVRQRDRAFMNMTQRIQELPSDLYGLQFGIERVVDHRAAVQCDTIIRAATTQPATDQIEAGGRGFEHCFLHGVGFVDDGAEPFETLVIEFIL